MWEMRVELEAVKEHCSKFNHHLDQVTITVRATQIRDGTPGISLRIADSIVGEWTDSKAGSLGLTRDKEVIVFGKKGEPRYKLILPGTTLEGKQVSNSEVGVTIAI